MITYEMVILMVKNANKMCCKCYILEIHRRVHGMLGTVVSEIFKLLVLLILEKYVLKVCMLEKYIVSLPAINQHVY